MVEVLEDGGGGWTGVWIEVDLREVRERREEGLSVGGKLKVEQE